MHWLKLARPAGATGSAESGIQEAAGVSGGDGHSPETGVGLHDYVHHKMWPELRRAWRQISRSRPLDELAHRVRELAAVARHFEGTLSIHSGSGKQAEVLESIGRATAGRVNYKISGELQLQLFDVLSEQPAGSRLARAV